MARPAPPSTACRSHQSRETNRHSWWLMFLLSTATQPRPYTQLDLLPRMMPSEGRKRGCRPQAMHALAHTPTAQDKAADSATSAQAPPARLHDARQACRPASTPTALCHLQHTTPCAQACKCRPFAVGERTLVQPGEATPPPRPNAVSLPGGTLRTSKAHMHAGWAVALLGTSGCMNHAARLPSSKSNRVPDQHGAQVPRHPALRGKPLLGPRTACRVADIAPPCCCAADTTAYLPAPQPHTWGLHASMTPPRLS